MLIGSSSKSPNIQTIRRIKQTLHEVLNLSDDATITVAELACLEEDCAPVETVFGLLRPDAPQVQHKVHKPTDGIDAQDLIEVCTEWGFDIPAAALKSFKKEN